MKKFFLWILSVVFVIFLNLPASASETEIFVEDTLEKFGERIEENIPEEAEEFLEKIDLSDLNLQQILSLQPKQFLQLILEQTAEKIRKPLKILGQILGVLLMYSLILPIKDSVLQEENSKIFSFAVGFSICFLIFEPVVNSIELVVKSLESCSVFLLSLIPILCGLLTASGHAATASVYQMLLFSLCQIFSQLAINLFLPFIEIYFALSLAVGIFPQLGMQNFSGGLKQVLCWILGAASTFFVALLSLQTFVTSNLDTVTLKTSKFLFGNFIPVVGSILSDAFSAAEGCLSLLKSTVGSFGIVVAFCTILPILYYHYNIFSLKKPCLPTLSFCLLTRVSF